MEPKSVSLDDAVRLIDERAAKGPAKKGGRKTARRKSAK
jgi:DNA topoisomerase-1